MKYLLALLVLVACTTRPVPDRATAEPGRYVRWAVDYRGEHCLSELPLAVAFDGVEPSDFFPSDAPWSQALGYPVTMAAREGERADLVVTINARPADQPTWVASTRAKCEGGRLRQVMSLYVAGDSVETYFIVMHELGHALGVQHGCDEYGHSCAEWSIMSKATHPTLLGWGSDSGDPPPQWVRPADEAALRRAWRRR